MMFKPPTTQRARNRFRAAGGMDKVVFSRDYAAVDAKSSASPLVELGVSIPAPDHRTAPDAKW